MSVLYDDVQMDWSINSQEHKSFQIYSVTIKISMTEYHHWINRQAYCLFYCLCAEMSKINPVTCLFSFFEALKGAFEVHFFRASFLHLIKGTDSILWEHAAQILKSENIVKHCI